ncbi:uncharacterized protein EV422DRAFT_541212 [Fimicolochytrium jonesii]|uniref:uncharacterized protein n=1 Tax=Fimicolochytrium jonesii TaxID=1396493 RepID=UPI0022FE5FE5|nr:uncharacterized protein EV422DRAFT_541212 [Fimicolochytrium jonesii]KAI8817572.1 hypothetical protein EV422DRAFT_541212 [Fimicolochytrium jonesii]
MHGLRSLAPSLSAARAVTARRQAACAHTFPLLAVAAASRPNAFPQITGVRTFYKKASLPPKHWTKPEVEAKVLDILFDYTNVSPEQVSLEANMVKDLSVGRLDRFGFFWDLQTEFEFFHLPIRTRTRDLASGREAADWVAAILEQGNRLKF